MILPRYHGCYVLHDKANILFRKVDGLIRSKLPRQGLGLEVLKSAEISFSDYFLAICKECEDSLVADLKFSIKCLHEAGLAHGCIGPQNILVYENDQGETFVKIVDLSQSILQKMASFGQWRKAVCDDEQALCSMLEELQAVKVYGGRNILSL